MTAINSALIATVDVQSLTAFTVSTTTLTLANTEYSVALPVGTKAFTIQNRDGGIVKLKHTSGGPYFTIHTYNPFPMGSVKSSATITLYLESPKPAQTIEIISWT